jgi:hypothetical protein
MKIAKVFVCPRGHDLKLRVWRVIVDGEYMHFPTIDDLQHLLFLHKIGQAELSLVKLMCPECRGKRTK